MAQFSSVRERDAGLDGVLLALADPTRRSVVRRLGRGPASVGDLARDAPMALSSFMKHVRTLEANGLISTVKEGRVRTCVLRRDRLALLDDWLAEQRRVWEERTDRLEQLVTTIVTTIDTTIDTAIDSAIDTAVETDSDADSDTDTDPDRRAP